MNNDLEQFSEERLKEIAMDAYEADFSCDEIEALARIALAAKQAKPAYWITYYPNSEPNEFDDRKHSHSGAKSCAARIAREIGGFIVPVYHGTPQPAHTEQANPVAWLLSGGGTKNIVSFDSSNAYADPLREVIPLYTNQQTNHARCVSWIKCSERMPETYLNVLLTDEADDICIGQLESHDDTDFFVVGCPRYKATHWMPLPASPKPESE